MSANELVINKKVFSQFIPLNSLSQVHLEEIVRKFPVEDIDAGKYLFREGESDNRNVYLISGEIVLVENKKEIERIAANKDQARYPLAHAQPRQLSAKAAVKSRIVRIDTDLLEMLLTWDQSSSYAVQDLEAADEDDWMSRMLQAELFVRIPASNIQKMLMKMQEVKMRAGDVVIKQGDEGDFYYIIKQGRCAVTRQAEGEKSPAKLAELSGGDSFGEDALISGKQRNATVTMLTDGALMKLDKDDFTELLKEPSLDLLAFSNATDLVQQQKATFLDVRFPGEFANGHIKGSMNIPLIALRDNLGQLDKNMQYITCCDTSKRSSAAAFLLGQKGFQAHVLENGILTVPKENLEQSIEQKAGVESGANNLNEFSAQNRKELMEEKNLLQKQLQEAEKKLEQKNKAIEAQKALVAQMQQEQEAQQKEKLAVAKNKGDQSELLIKKMQAQLESLQNEKKQLEKKAVELEQAQNQARDKDQSLQQELTTIKAKYDESKQNADEYRARVSELEKTNARLSAKEEQMSDKLEAEKASVVFLQSQMSGKDQSVAQLEQQVSDLGGALARLEKEHDAQKKAFNDVELKHQQSIKASEADKNEVASLREALAAKEKELQQLPEISGKLATAEHALGEKNTELDLLRIEQGKLEQSNRDLQQQGVEASRVLDEAKAVQVRLQHEYSGLQQSLLQQEQKSEALVAGLKAELDQAKKNAQQAVAEAGGRDNVVKEINQKLEEEKVKSQSLKEETIKLQSEIDKRALEIGSQQEKVAQTERSLAESRQEREKDKQELQDRIAKLTQQLGKMQEENLQVQKELAQAKSWEEKAQAADQEKSRLGLDREALLVKHVSLEKEFQFISGELDRYKNSDDAHIVQLKKLETEIQNRNQKIEKLDDQVAGLLSESGSRQGEIQRLSGEVVSKSKEVEQLVAETEASKRRIAEMESLLAKSEGEGEALNRLTKDRQLLEQELSAVRAELAEVNANRESQNAQLAQQGLQIDELQKAITDAAEKVSNVESHGEQAESDLRKELEARFVKQMAEQEQEWQKRIQETEAATKENLAAIREQLQLRESAQRTAEEQRAAAEIKISELIAAAELQPSSGAVTANDGVTQRLRDQLDEEKSQREYLESRIASIENEQQTLRASLQSAEDKAKMEANLRVEVESERRKLEAQLQEARTSEELDGLFGGGDANSSKKSVELDRDSQLAQALSSQYVTALHAPETKKSSPMAIWALSAVSVLLVIGNLVQFFMKGSAGPSTTELVTTDSGQAQDNAAGTAADVTSGDKAVVADASKPASSVDKGALPKVVSPGPVVKGKKFTDPLASKAKAPEMISVAAGDFMMGSNKGYASADEQPHHSVRIKPFAISRNEITFDEYGAFAKATGKPLPNDKGWGQGNRPVINVSWKDAKAYTAWLSKQTGKNYRLPTEAEWEYVAKGGTDYSFWWGGEIGQNKANCFDCGSGFDGRGTSPVGSFPENQFGTFDLLGNVAEWVEDCFHQDYEGAPKDGSAWVEQSCAKRVVRGGSFLTASNNMRVTKRSSFSESSQVDNIGFRVVRD